MIYIKKTMKLLKMKNIIYALCTIIVLFCACKKEESTTSYASINVVNAAIGSGTVKVNYHGKPISWAAYSGSIGAINYAASQILMVFNLNNNYPFTIVPALDTLKPVFNKILPMEPSGMYTLFTTGQAPASYDAVFVEESNIPYNLRDSAIAVRFINLSPNSSAVNVTLASAPTVNLVTGLAYKQLTEFKQYPLKKIVPAGSMTFEVRDAVSSVLLTSYTVPAAAVQPYPAVSTSLSRFKSVTLVVKGLMGTTAGTNAYGLFPVAQY